MFIFKSLFVHMPSFPWLETRLTFEEVAKLFQSDCTIFHSHKQCIRVSGSSRYCQHRMFSLFIINSNRGVLVSHCALIAVSLMTSDDEYICVLIYEWMCVSVSRSVVSNSLQPHKLYPDRLLCSWDFSRQEYWSGLPFPPPGDLPDLGIEPVSPALASGFFTTAPHVKLHNLHTYTTIKSNWSQI